MGLLKKQTDSVPWIEEKFLRLDGTTVDVEVSAVAFSHQGRPAVQVIFRDITERKLVAERLHRMALFDPLTGLPNRTLFFDRMSLVLTFAKRNNYIIALLYLDLDRFKTINDTLGHDIGDLLLKEVAGRIASCTRQSDTVARMGGDEFITICARVTAPQDAGVVAAKVIKVLSEPFHLQGEECNIGASIGISLYPADGEDVETLLKRADSAMYRVKQTGKGGFAFYSGDEGGTPC
jgi:diguanylate cyclase (GGDEF)-like protein